MHWVDKRGADAYQLISWWYILPTRAAPATSKTLQAQVFCWINIIGLWKDGFYNFKKKHNQWKQVLKQLGVVHLLAGGCSLIGCCFMGPRLGRSRLMSFILCLSFSLATEIRHVPSQVWLCVGLFSSWAYILAREHNLVGDCVQFLCHHVQMSQSRNTIELGN